MNRIDDSLAVSTAAGKDYKFSADQVITVLGGGRGTPRATVTASYHTTSTSPTVYYTGLRTDGSVLVARTTSGVTLVHGFYTYAQSVTGITDFLAVWDEGDASDYVSEWIVVDT